jgi:hypothetical protein
MPQNRTGHEIPDPSTAATPATDHVRSEDSNLTFLIGEWAFKVMFAFLGVMATTLSLLSPHRREHR